MSKKYFTLLIAPGIPVTECKSLKAHWQEAVLDNAYSVVLNYECRAYLIPASRNSQYFITAPGIPAGEVKELRKQIDKAKKAKRSEDRVVVCNYEMRLQLRNAKSRYDGVIFC